MKREDEAIFTKRDIPLLRLHHHWIPAVARTLAVAVDSRTGPGAGIRSPVAAGRTLAAGDNSLPGREEAPEAVGRIGVGIEGCRLRRRNPYSTWSDDGEAGRVLVAVG